MSEECDEGMATRLEIAASLRVLPSPNGSIGSTRVPLPTGTPPTKCSTSDRECNPVMKARLDSAPSSSLQKNLGICCFGLLPGCQGVLSRAHLGGRAADVTLGVKCPYSMLCYSMLQHLMVYYDNNMQFASRHLWHRSS